MTSNSIEFQTKGIYTNSWVMRITADRRIEVAEGVDVTETAKKVLEAMQWMLDKQQRPSRRDITWVGLTDEEIGDALSVWELTEEWPTFAYAARAIEAKLKEKNT